MLFSFIRFASLFTREPVFLIINIFPLFKMRVRTEAGMEYMPGKDVGNIWANIAGMQHSFTSSPAVFYCQY